MIYGINFCERDIPPGIKRKFAERVRVHVRPDYGGVTHRVGKCCVWAYLKGVAQTVEERDQMLSVADNGHRKLHVEKRLTAGEAWWGIYVY